MNQANSLTLTVLGILINTAVCHCALGSETLAEYLSEKFPTEAPIVGKANLGSGYDPLHPGTTKFPLTSAAVPEGQPSAGFHKETFNETIISDEDNVTEFQRAVDQRLGTNFAYAFFSGNGSLSSNTKEFLKTISRSHQITISFGAWAAGDERIVNLDDPALRKAVLDGSTQDNNYFYLHGTHYVFYTINGAAVTCYVTLQTSDMEKAQQLGQALAASVSLQAKGPAASGSVNYTGTFTTSQEVNNALKNLHATAEIVADSLNQSVGSMHILDSDTAVAAFVQEFNTILAEAFKGEVVLAYKVHPIARDFNLAKQANIPVASGDLSRVLYTFLKAYAENEDLLDRLGEIGAEPNSSLNGIHEKLQKAALAYEQWLREQSQKVIANGSPPDLNKIWLCPIPPELGDKTVDIRQVYTGTDAIKGYFAYHPRMIQITLDRLHFDWLDSAVSGDLGFAVTIKTNGNIAPMTLGENHKSTEWGPSGVNKRNVTKDIGLAGSVLVPPAFTKLSIYFTLTHSGDSNNEARNDWEMIPADREAKSLPELLRSGETLSLKWDDANDPQHGNHIFRIKGNLDYHLNVLY